MKKDSFEKKLAAYVATAAAYLATHPVEANAQVMYTDVTPDDTIHNSFFNLDLNNDGVTDFKLQNSWASAVNFSASGYGTSSHLIADFINPLNQNIIVAGSTYSLFENRPAPLAVNEVIDNLQPFTSDSHLYFRWNFFSHHYGGPMTTFGTTYGYALGNDELFGLKLISNGNTYYGWVRLDVRDTAIILKDYAINSVPDSSINAGSTNGCSPNNYMTPTGSQLLCPNDSVTVTVHNAVGQNIQWLKNGGFIAGETDSLFTAIDPGNYSVLVSNGNCAAIAGVLELDSAYINIDANVINTTCSLNNGHINLAVTGNLSPYLFNWSSGATTENVHYIASGSYTVTVSASLCNVTDTLLINVGDSPPPILTETYSDSVCNDNGYIDLTVTNGTPPYDYEWSNWQSTEDQSGLTSGIYTVTVTDFNYCIAIDTIQIFDSGFGLTEIHVPSCDTTGSINLSIVDPDFISTTYTYLWNDGETSEDINHLVSGTYSVTVTDMNGCTNSLSVLISLFNIPNPHITNNGNVLNTIGAGIDTGSTFQWYLNGIPISGATNHNYVATQSGTYTVVVSNSAGCNGVTPPFDFIYNSVNELVNSEIEILIDDKQLYVLNNTLMGSEIDIVNALGQLVVSVTVTNQTPSADLSALPGGIYFYHIRSKQKTYSGKFIIK